LNLGRKEIKKYLSREEGFPKFGYPEYYNCVYATISEIIRQKNEKQFFNSLIPGLNLDSLPSYCIINDSIRKINDINAENLGRKKSFDILGIKYSIKSLKSSQKAIQFYRKKTTKNKALLLIGTVYYLPFAEKLYRSSLFIKNCIKEGRVPANWSIFYGTSEKEPIIYSPNVGFFGRIPQSEFIWYWQGTKSLPGLSRIKLRRKIPAYQIVDIDESYLKAHSVGMLYEALKINIDEFYKIKRRIKSKNIFWQEGHFNI
jgi:hypothetical protein